MKKLIFMCVILAGCSAACDYASTNEIEPAQMAANQATISEGDSVAVVATPGADVWSRQPMTVVGFAPTGARGLVERVRSADTWLQVSWDDAGIEGLFVETIDMEVVDGGDPPCTDDCPPPPCTDDCPPPPTGNFRVAISGCSSGSQDVLRGMSRVGAFTYNGSNPGMSGRAIDSYGEPSSPNYPLGQSVLSTAVADLQGNIDLWVWTICMRLDDGRGRDWARQEDAPYPLAAGASGSPSSEMDMAIHAITQINAVAPGVPVVALGIHDYTPASYECRKLGAHGVTATETIADSLATLGLTLSPTLNGAAFRHVPVPTPAGVKPDGCHATEDHADVMALHLDQLIASILQ